jgi:hypothetical protein
MIPFVPTGVVAGVESGVYRPMATIAVADVETDL